MASVTGRRGLDAGRLVMVPFAALMLTLDLLSLRSLLLVGAPGASGALGWLSTALISAFYVLIIAAYLRRGPAVSTTASPLASIVAIAATLTSFGFPLLHGTARGPGWQVAADLLLVAGTGWSLWSLRWLGRNLSVIAQARAVADRGPYRLVRHPLYVGEVFSALGLALMAGTAAAFALWVALITMQAYRAHSEEKVLLTALSGYAEYRARTAALLPGIF